VLIFRSEKGKNFTIPFEPEILKIISNAHSNYSSVKIKHNGIHTTLHNIQADFIYWAKMKQDITDFVTSCPECLEMKPEKPIKMPQIIETVGPRYRIIVDLYQIPTEQSDAALVNGHTRYKYVLMCVDHFSKYLK